MSKPVRIDSDVHVMAEEIRATYPQMSRPSKQQLINQTLRDAFARRQHNKQPAQPSRTAKGVA